MKQTLALLLLVLTVTTVFGSNDDHEKSWNNPALNTAADARYLTSLEREVILEINKLRSNPAQYAEDYMVPLKNNYKHNILFYPGDKPLKTAEGVDALNECIQELQKLQPLPLIYPSEGLTKAARDHVNDQSKSGKTGHVGGDHSKITDRIERYGRWNQRIAENIAYGGISAQQVVVYLLIDDGVKNRGHRENFLHPDFKWIGVASGRHPEYRNMWVMDFAGEFTNN